MVKITGTRRFADRLNRLTGPEAASRIGAALFAAGEEIEVEAELSITRGSVSGKNHVPSAPGEPPNADTRGLDGNIETVQVEPLLVKVSSNARYAAALEFGTSRMEARPYMRPALLKKRFAAAKGVVRAVNSLSRKRG